MVDANKDESVTQTGQDVIKRLKEHLKLDIKPEDIDIANILGILQ